MAVPQFDYPVSLNASHAYSSLRLALVLISSLPAVSAAAASNLVFETVGCLLPAISAASRLFPQYGRTLV